MGKSIQMGSQVNRRPTSEGERGEWRRGTAARSSVRVASVRPHLFEWGGITHAETATDRHLLGGGWGHCRYKGGEETGHVIMVG